MACRDEQMKFFAAARAMCRARSASPGTSEPSAGPPDSCWQGDCAAQFEVSLVSLVVSLHPGAGTKCMMATNTGWAAGLMRRLLFVQVAPDELASITKLGVPEARCVAAKVHACGA